MNQENLSTLHDIAMEFAEEAHFAKNRGEEKTAKLFYQKAFSLEKRYALSFPTESPYQLSRAVFLRSAAHLALNSGYFQEAVKLAQLGLSNTHPDFIKEFQMILQKGKTNNNPQPSEIFIKGILILADLSTNQIKVKDQDSQRLYTIFVPNEHFEQLVLTFWAKPVSIKGKTNEQGEIQLEEIKKAA